jgi:vacuolar-type H+-ATPase subunit I/STV1
MENNTMESTDNIIDNAVSEASSAETIVPEIDNVEEAEAQDIEQPQEDGDESEQGDEAKQSDLPKEVKKALDKNKRYIRNLREREKGLLAEIQKLKSEKIEATKIDPNSFDGTYADLIKKESMEEMKALLSQNQQEHKINQLTLQQQQIMAEQDQAITVEAAEYAKQSDDFAKVVPANAEKLDSLPPEVQRMFYELESPSLAVYALAKEGRIEQLAYMSPYMAAAELVQAQSRGQQYLQASSRKQVSNAPAPIQGVRGTAKTAPARLSEKNPDDLYKWINN